MEGMLANDLLGFHTKYYCNNFIRCCQRKTQAIVDTDYSLITSEYGQTKVMPFPISIDYMMYNKRATNLNKKVLDEVRQKYKQKIQAVDKLLERNPKLIGKFVFLDVTALAGSHKSLPAGKKYHDECIKLMYEVNEKYETDEWSPIHLTEFFVKPKELCAIYNIADICLITPLHDGMNLVAKEYVASKPNLDGVLILSEFAGAAVELTESLIVNPFSVNELVESIEQAIAIDLDEKRWRMKVLRDRVSSFNVFDWAMSFFMELSVLHKGKKMMEKNGD